MKKQIILIALFLLTGLCNVFGQAVGIGTAQPHASSILDVESTTKGFLPPRMTTAQRQTIASPAQGLMIYNTSINCLEYWNSTQWQNFCGVTITDPSTNGTATATYNCATGADTGTLTVGTAPSGVTKVIVANVTQAGTYNITATANNVTYAASGTFTALGSQNITLTATGTPATAGSTTFALNTTPGCSFNKTVAAPLVNSFTTKIPVYNGNSVIDTQGMGYYDIAIPAASTIVLEVDVKVLGAYNLTGSVNITTESPITNLAITPQTLTYSASGTFTVLGLQNVTFTRTAVTPKWYGSRDITISGTGVSNTKVISPRIDILTLPTASTSAGTVNSSTGKTWMNKNLGAHRVAIQYNDPLAYGNRFQWGRGTDGHERMVLHGNRMNSSFYNDNVGLNNTIATLSNTDTPGHGNFIITTSASSFDWRSPKNDNLWQGVNGTNNPCPTGFRLPTSADLAAEVTTYSINNRADAYASPLKFTVPGSRNSGNGLTNGAGTVGSYWSSSVSGTSVISQGFGSSATSQSSHSSRAFGLAVRCVKD